MCLQSHSQDPCGVAAAVKATFKNVHREWDHQWPITKPCWAKALPGPTHFLQTLGWHQERCQWAPRYPQAPYWGPISYSHVEGNFAAASVSRSDRKRNKRAKKVVWWNRWSRFGGQQTKILQMTYKRVKFTSSAVVLLTAANQMVPTSGTFISSTWFSERHWRFHWTTMTLKHR